MPYDALAVYTTFMLLPYGAARYLCLLFLKSLRVRVFIWPRPRVLSLSALQDLGHGLLLVPLNLVSRLVFCCFQNFTVSSVLLSSNLENSAALKLSSPRAISFQIIRWRFAVMHPYTLPLICLNRILALFPRYLPDQPRWLEIGLSPVDSVFSILVAQSCCVSSSKIRGRGGRFSRNCKTSLIWAQDYG